MQMIKARQISPLAELVVSMHGRTEYMAGRTVGAFLIIRQRRYGHTDQTFACWHINQGHVPLCPPRVSRT